MHTRFVEAVDETLRTGSRRLAGVRGEEAGNAGIVRDVEERSREAVVLRDCVAILQGGEHGRHVGIAVDPPEESIHAFLGGLPLIVRQPQQGGDHGPALHLPAEEVELAVVLALAGVADALLEVVDAEDLHGCDAIGVERFRQYTVEGAECAAVSTVTFSRAACPDVATAIGSARGLGVANPQTRSDGDHILLPILRSS